MLATSLLAFASLLFGLLKPSAPARVLLWSERVLYKSFSNFPILFPLPFSRLSSLVL